MLLALLPFRPKSGKLMGSERILASAPASATGANRTAQSSSFCVFLFSLSIFACLCACQADVSQMLPMHEDVFTR